MARHDESIGYIVAAFITNDVRAAARSMLGILQEGEIDLPRRVAVAPYLRESEVWRERVREYV
jgi:hypothetical protein